MGKWHTKDLTETKVCLCGCGTTILKWKSNLSERFYVRYHQPRTKPQSFIEYRRVEWTRNNPIKKRLVVHPNKRMYPREYEKVRAILLKNSSCESCGITCFDKKLQIHHKDGNTYNNATNNLKVVCRGCHNKEHLK